MKLLFDQNLSPVLAVRLSDIFPGSEHVFPLNMSELDDTSVCEFALENGFAVVSKDADYCDLLSLRPRSPKIVWIRTGNCSTRDVEALFRRHAEQIIAFGANDSVVLLMLF